MHLASRIAVSLVLFTSLATGAETAPPVPQPATYLARLASARIPADAAAVVVKPLDGGMLNWAANEKKPMNPASTMKLVTTYSALHLLGPAFTFRTEVYEFVSDRPALDLLIGGPELRTCIEQAAPVDDWLADDARAAAEFAADRRPFLLYA